MCTRGLARVTLRSSSNASPHRQQVQVWFPCRVHEGFHGIFVPAMALG